MTRARDRALAKPRGPVRVVLGSPSADSTSPRHPHCIEHRLVALTLRHVFNTSLLHSRPSLHRSPVQCIVHPDCATAAKLPPARGRPAPALFISFSLIILRPDASITLDFVKERPPPPFAPETTSGSGTAPGPGLNRLSLEPVSARAEGNGGGGRLMHMSDPPPRRRRRRAAWACSRLPTRVPAHPTMGPCRACLISGGHCAHRLIAV